jgi:hypothetical protein
VAAYIESANDNRPKQKKTKDRNAGYYIFKNEKMKRSDLQQICHDGIDFVGPLVREPSVKVRNPIFLSCQAA